MDFETIDDMVWAATIEAVGRYPVCSLVTGNICYWED